MPLINHPLITFPPGAREEALRREAARQRLRDQTGNGGCIVQDKPDSACWMTVKECMDLFGKSYNITIRLLHKLDLQPVKFVSSYYYKRDEIEKLADDMKKDAMVELPEGWIPAIQAAGMAGCPVTRIYNLAAAGTIRTYKIKPASVAGGKVKVFYNLEDVEAYCRRRHKLA